MAAQSKLLTRLPYNCYDVGHTWTPHCTLAAAFIFVDCFLYSSKLYSSLYIITFLLRRKKLTWHQIKQTVIEIFQSACFLTWNGFAFVASICIYRWLFGYFSFINAGLLPGITSSFMAILLERKSRRKLLAVYVLNVVLDAIYRMLIARRYFHPIPNGEILLFSASMAGFLYFYRKRDNLQDVTGKVLSYFLGFEEGGSNTSHSLKRDEMLISKSKQCPEENKDKYLPRIDVTNKNFSQYYPKIFYSIQEYLKLGPRHKLCLHEHSCHYYWISSFLRPFVLGISAQLVISFLTSLPKVIKHPSVLKKQLLKSNTFRFGAFLGSFCAVFKMANCLLRWIQNSDSPSHGLITGFLAGLTMKIYPMPSIALYTFCKLLDILYTKGINAGYCPSVPYGVELLYALLTGFMFHVAVLEPHNLKPSYWKFLLRLTNNKMLGINRHLLEPFGTQSSKMVPKLIYKYNHDYTSQYLKDVLKATTGSLL